MLGKIEGSKTILLKGLRFHASEISKSRFSMPAPVLAEGVRTLCSVSPLSLTALIFGMPFELSLRGISGYGRLLVLENVSKPITANDVAEAMTGPTLAY